MICNDDENIAKFGSRSRVFTHQHINNQQQKNTKLQPKSRRALGEITSINQHNGRVNMNKIASKIQGVSIVQPAKERPDSPIEHFIGVCALDVPYDGEIDVGSITKLSLMWPNETSEPIKRELILPDLEPPEFLFSTSFDDEEEFDFELQL